MVKRTQKRRYASGGRTVSKAERVKNKELRAELARFVADRDAALLSMDRATFLAFVLKWKSWTGVNPAMLKSEALTLAVMHKMRTAATSLPLTARRESKHWLEDNGMKSEDGGVL